MSSSQRRTPIWTNASGSIATLFGLALPVILLIAAGGMDYARLSAQRSALQGAADAAALAAARDMSMTDTRRYDLSEVAQGAASAFLSGHASANDRGAITVSATVDQETLGVTANASQPFTPVFGILQGLIPQNVTASASARIMGRPNICVLALERSELGAIWLARSARLTGDNCSIFSNSTSSFGIVVRDSANVSAKAVCSAGGVEGGGAITPAAFTDCPQFEDPLASRTEPAPPPGRCDFNNVSISNQTTTLQPGIYCGKLDIVGSADVTMAPGDYFIADGRFLMSGKASLKGDDVSIYLGASAFLSFGGETSVRLSARRTGPMAGLLFFGSRSQSTKSLHTILSRNAQYLVGTVYLPGASFVVDGEAGVGSQSAYTAIVARRLVLKAGPHLILNSRYDETDVPVPEGIRGATQPAKLVK